MFLRSLSLTAACLLLPAEASARRILVDPSGGGEPGYDTILNLAGVPFAALEPGSEVRVRSGTYRYPVVIT